MNDGSEVVVAAAEGMTAARGIDAWLDVSACAGRVEN